MTLTQNHRAALLEVLIKTQSDKDRTTQMLTYDQPDIYIVQALEIDEWLCQQRIKLITAAITDNDIDY